MGTACSSFPALHATRWLSMFTLAGMNVAPVLLAIFTAGLAVGCKLGCGPGDEAAAPADPGALPDPALVWHAPIEIASGRAQVGPWRMNQSDFDYVDDPAVAVREDGVIGAAWADNHRKQIFFRAYDPSTEPGLTQPVNVSRHGHSFSWLPRMAMSKDGGVWVLWQEIVFSGGSHGGEIFFARSHDGGKSFDAPLNLSRSTAGDGKGRLSRERWDNGSLDLIRGANGELFACWTEYEGALWFTRSLDDGKSFADPVRVAGSDAEPARGPALAADASGVVYLGWALGDRHAAGIRLAISDNGGQTFGPARTLLEGDGYADAPKLAVDRTRRLHVVVSQSASAGSGGAHVRHARLAPNGSIEEVRTISAPGASFPSLAIHGPDDLYVLWEHHPDVREAARGLGFTRSMDGGRTFVPPSLVPGTADEALGVNGSRQGKLARKLAVGDDGTIAVVSSHFLAGQRSKVLLIRGQLRARQESAARP
jgi:hypothetical protein